MTSMIAKFVAAGALVAVMSVPAFAATTYYVASNVKTHKCEVTSKKPDGKTWSMVGTDTFKTKADATKAMKADADCKA
jgi:hypothetical protein